MKPRIRLMLVAVAILIGVNAWRWWPQPEQETSGSRVQNAPLPEGFELRLAGHEPASTGPGKIQRDLFFPVKTTPEPKAEQPEVKQQAQVQQSNTLEQQVMQKLGEYKLVGILLQEGVKRAFLTHNDQNYTVSRGDRVNDQYIVEEVTLTSVTLSEVKSRISKKIELE